jgi:hypothetical protein
MVMERLNVVLEVATLGLGRGRGEACGGGRVGFGGGWLGFRRQRGIGGAGEGKGATTAAEGVEL